jgi:pyridoxine/pyridoxamine 5'-phosphate oxidase
VVLGLLYDFNPKLRGISASFVWNEFPKTVYIDGSENQIATAERFETYWLIHDTCFPL